MAPQNVNLSEPVLRGNTAKALATSSKLRRCCSIDGVKNHRGRTERCTDWLESTCIHKALSCRFSQSPSNRDTLGASFCALLFWLKFSTSCRHLGLFTLTTGCWVNCRLENA